MVINKRKKNTRQRGSMTHGWGAKKKHRGSGNRGGKGNAGTGKRGDQNKPSIWENPYFGKIGFGTKKKGKKEKGISIRKIEQTLERLTKEGSAVKKGDGFEINLEKAGYDKLLSQGKANQKYIIHVKSASKKSIDKIKEKKGDVILTKKQEVKEKIVNKEKGKGNTKEKPIKK
ncbi:MAG: uL15 family ribosomal protein [Candidatus Woesearchaeota archaeon]